MELKKNLNIFLVILVFLFLGSGVFGVIPNDVNQTLNQFVSDNGFDENNSEICEFNT